MGVKIKGNYRISTEKPTGDYLVRFFDYDGTILKQQWVNHGEDATPPNLKNHDYLIFYEWNNEYTNITERTDIGAIYDTIDNNSYFFVRIGKTSLYIEMYIKKYDTSNTIVDWGDGSSDVISSGTLVVFSHTYTSIGDYVIKITANNSTQFGYDYGQTNYGNLFNQQHVLIKSYIGNNISSSYGYSLFKNARNLNYVSLNKGLSGSWSLPFQDSGVIHVNLPSQSSGQQNMFTSCYSLKTFTINKNAYGYASRPPYSSSGLIYLPLYKYTILSTEYCSNLNEIEYNQYITSIPSNGLTDNKSLKKLELPPSLTTIGSNAFNGCFILNTIIIRAITPPSIGSTIFPYNNVALRIYVPDISLNDYKTATNWVTYSDYIYPLSEYIP